MKYLIFALFFFVFLNKNTWADVIEDENGIHKICDRVPKIPGEICGPIDPICKCASEITCCNCFKPECQTDADCHGSKKCYKNGECIAMRRMIFKRSYTSPTTTSVRGEEVYEDSDFCESDSDCHDSTFCNYGNCVPRFLLKTTIFDDKTRVKRGGAHWPVTDYKKKCVCNCMTDEKFPDYCFPYFKPCQNDNDCANRNIFCIDNICKPFLTQ